LYDNHTAQQGGVVPMPLPLPITVTVSYTNMEVLTYLLLIRLSSFSLFSSVSFLVLGGSPSLLSLPFSVLYFFFFTFIANSFWSFLYQYTHTFPHPRIHILIGILSISNLHGLDIPQHLFYFLTSVCFL